MNRDVRKRIPVQDTSMDDIIKYGGYYDIDNQWNNITVLPDYPGKIFRGRVEVFIFDEQKRIYVALLGDHKYRIPGGSIDIDLSHEDQAYMEAKEEAKLLIKNIRFTGISYTRIFKTKFSDPKMKVVWDGCYTEVYIADLDRKYNGIIAKEVEDNNIFNNGKFHNIESIYPFLNEHHRKIFNYNDAHLEGTNPESTETDMIFRNCANFIRNELSKFLIDKNNELYLKCNRFFHANQSIKEYDGNKLVFGYYENSSTPSDSIILLVNHLNFIVGNSNNFNKIRCNCDNGFIYCEFNHPVCNYESELDQEYNEDKLRIVANIAKDEVQKTILGSINHNMDKFIRLKGLKNTGKDRISVGEYDEDNLQVDNIKTITNKVNKELIERGYSNSIEFSDNMIYIR